MPVTEVRVSGGGSQSPAAVQLTADIFGLPASRPHTHETSGLGAAIDAAVGLGLHPSFEAAVAAMTRVAETRDPDPADHALYEDLYRSVYLRLYDRLRPLYEEIRRITGLSAGGLRRLRDAWSPPERHGPDREVGQGLARRSRPPPAPRSWSASASTV